MIKQCKNIFTAVFLGVFCATIFVVATSENASSQSQYFRVKSHLQFNKNFVGKASVIDGDSLKVGNREVRLFGIDAPEYHQNCFDEKNKEYACGQASRDFLVDLAQKREVKCIYAEKDKYERFLGKCFVGNIYINEELIKNGMAVIYNFTESDDKMDELESEAKKQKIGIWQGAFQLPKDYRKSHPRK